jgi:NAD(P)H-hydrate epimerase
MTAPMPQDGQGLLAASAEAELLALAKASNVVALGPGLGRSSSIIVPLVAILRHFNGSVVLDADGLNAFAQHTELLQRSAPLILTPHPGEFSRLLNVEIPQVQAHRCELATAFARQNGVVVLLKGHRTIVTDGRRVYENTTGNPGMATAGCGDVLTGLIAALLAQGMESFAAAQLGAYVHGLAGDLAKAEHGEVGMIAADVLKRLPRALRQAAG